MFYTLLRSSSIHLFHRKNSSCLVDICFVKVFEINDAIHLDLSGEEEEVIRYMYVIVLMGQMVV